MNDCHTLKYNLQRKLDSLNNNEKQWTKEELPTILECRWETVLRWAKILKEDSYSIPEQKFLKLCEFFNIEPWEMRNYDYVYSKVEL